MPAKKKQYGFSLFELLLVMVLIALALGIALPRLIVTEDVGLDTFLQKEFQDALVRASVQGDDLLMVFENRYLQLDDDRKALPEGMRFPEKTEFLVTSDGYIVPGILEFVHDENERVRSVGLLGRIYEGSAPF